MATIECIRTDGLQILAEAHCFQIFEAPECILVNLGDAVANDHTRSLINIRPPFFIRISVDVRDFSIPTIIALAEGQRFIAAVIFPYKVAAKDGFGPCRCSRKQYKHQRQGDASKALETIR